MVVVVVGSRQWAAGTAGSRRGCQPVKGWYDPTMEVHMCGGGDGGGGGWVQCSWARLIVVQQSQPQQH